MNKDNNKQAQFRQALPSLGGDGGGQSVWIWYPGDYEIWLGNNMNNRRTERGAFFPPFWKTDTHYPVVEFSKTVDLKENEEINIAVEGKYNVKIDGKLQFGMPKRLTINVGRHNLNIKVWNQSTPPCIFVDGKTINSDSTWRVTYEDKEWIDESGKASDTSATVYMDAGSWNFNSASLLPSSYHLPRERKDVETRRATSHDQETSMPSQETYHDTSLLYDFGRETFGYLVLKDIHGNGHIDIYYGESAEEAQDVDACETLDRLYVEGGQVTDLALDECRKVDEGEYTLGNSKAFRYVMIVCSQGVDIGSVAMDYEYSPQTVTGSFKCDDDELNEIWRVAAYTMHLTTREFFIDGIKRDRWTWSGDAIQSYLMNYYLFFDSDAVRRTIWLLRGKDPVTSHVNTIMDYTFFWFNSIYDYYLYTGDAHFVSQIYPRMKTLMDYVLARRDADGMVEGLAGDWVFVDWADGAMSKHGALAFEQVLLCKSLETMSLCAALVEPSSSVETYRDTSPCQSESSDSQTYHSLASELKGKIISTFWNKDKHALVHNFDNGKQSEKITRYANIFAIIYQYLSSDEQEAIKKDVLLNDDVMKITTPYMRFYELEAICMLGGQKMVMKEMKDYWGGMLKEGATSFWEKYNPDEHGAQHLAMYGRPYGKSLCHAWGASPIYLLGRYYLGVTPTSPGYAEYQVRPCLGGLKWMVGDVPTPFGKIHVRMDEKCIRVKSDGGHGTLVFNDRKVEIPAGEEIYVSL